MAKLKEELGKYKAALKQETENRSQAEDKIKIMEITANLKDNENTQTNNDKSLPKPTENVWEKFKQSSFIQENTETVPKKAFECEHCDSLFSNETGLAEHVKKKHIKETCEKCPKQYSSKFQMQRHIWRSHEEINCNLCEINLQSRHDLKRHKVEDHKITQSHVCKFFKENRCVDDDECLYKHDVNDTTSETTSERAKNDSNTNETKFCKKGLKCLRTECPIGDSGHQRIRDVPCKYKERCNKRECPFKHTNEKSVFVLKQRNQQKT